MTPPAARGEGEMPELNRIYQGDCLEIMRGWPDKCVDLIITDPPYDRKTHGGAVLGDMGIDFKPLDRHAETVTEFLRISRRWVIAFCSLEQLGEYKRHSRDAWIRGGVWDRIINMPQISGDRPAQGAEGVAIMHNPGKKKWNGGGAAAFWRCDVERGQKEHPTQKPLKLMQKLVSQFSFEGETVLDCFSGSGTTLLACQMLNRNWIGIEMEQKYIDVATRRIAAEMSQGKLL